MSDQILAAAEMAAQWWTDRLTAGDRGKFKDRLKDIIEAELRQHGHIALECDYDPDRHLISALAAAGVECKGFLFSAQGIFPTKHGLDVTPDNLGPKEGYGNWTAIIPVAPP